MIKNSVPSQTFVCTLGNQVGWRALSVLRSLIQVIQNQCCVPVCQETLFLMIYADLAVNDYSNFT